MKESCKDYLSRSESKSFNEILFSFIDEKKVKDSEIYKKVDIDRKLFSKIRCNSNYIPKKNTVIKLCLSLSLDKNRFKPNFVPAGQTTQLIVGATPESDLKILKLSEGLYQKLSLKR